MKKLPVIGAAAASLILVTPAAAQATPPYDVAVGGSIVDSPGTGLCDFWFTGSADATFDETTQRLAIVEAGFDGSLSVENVSGDCLGMFALGEPVDLQVSLSLSIPDGPLNIS